MSFDIPGKPDLVTLYSDRNLPFEDHIYFRLADYRGAIDRLANDDLLVGSYLLRRATTLMGRLINIQVPQTRKEEPRYHELRSAVHGIVANAWNLVYELERSKRVSIMPTALHCYEELTDEMSTRYERFTNWKEFTDGYSEQWVLARWNPRKVEVEGSDVYCMLLNARREDGKEGLVGLALPFSEITSVFADVQSQIAEPLG